MITPADASTPETLYAPKLRTALVLSGTGTAGAYHAGVLRALHEAGIKIDLVAGRGIGVVAALFAAVDLAPRLWEKDGVWRQRQHLAQFYRWRLPWQLVGWGIALCLACLCAPVALLIALVIAYPVVLLSQLVGGSMAEVVASAYGWILGALQQPADTAAFVARLVAAVVLTIAVAVAILALARSRGLGRRESGALWWRAFGAPLDQSPVIRWLVSGFWQAIRGATAIAEPTPQELSRRYADLLSESLAQPEYRELIFVAHDLEARRDIVFALLQESHRRSFFSSAVGSASASRHAELIDLAGAGRDLLIDGVAAALAVPGVCEPQRVRFAPESYWRGETHRLQDRPAAVARLIEEVSAAGAEQVILVSADADLEGPHALSPAPVEPRARIGEMLLSSESAAIRDAVTALFDRFSGLFQIRPSHNPLGPFAFGGAYDPRSDRVQSLSELADRGYEDAYRQFIEPIVGAPGDERWAARTNSDEPVREPQATRPV